MTYLIYGNGWIGNKINDYLSDSIISPNYINNYEDIINDINKYNPKIIINCIGKTGRPNIDWCENHKEETLFSNVTIPLLIAKACHEKNINMIHIGTGCIYENGVFWEEDKPNYIKSYYSKTKFIAEELLKDFDILQLRIRMPIDDSSNPRNLINKLFSYKKVIDVQNSVTIVEDFLYVLHELIMINAKGVFNVVNPEPIGHKEIIGIFSNYIGEFKGTFIKPEELITIAGRSNCILSTSKLNSLGIFLRPTKEALEDCAKKMGALCRV